ncbi:lrr and pyd [Lynx pardinus]|uniref:NACHT, LRR and PYD domains-containing protein 12 n=1 Tax=Lynx pardinus TaxID=191816 RepID=A0A485MR51_LYNPA|nr:lrr and pyd [Lynx pardinus]
MPRAPLSDSLCRLSAYLEELEAVELKKFKLYLGALPEAEGGRIPWGKLEPAGPLDTAQLLVAHCGPGAAWPLALGLFRRIHRRDLWERGQREDPVRDTPPDGSSSLESQSVCCLEVFPGTPRKDPRETYKDYVRRKFRLMQDRNARLGECVNLSRRYTRLLLVKEHSTPMWAQQKLLDTGWGQARAVGHQASLIQMETLFEPDEERPEPPRTVVLQGAAGMGKSMLAHKDTPAGDDGLLFISEPWLRKCELEAGACQEIASVLSTNQHLVELDLAGNSLEDLGLRLLCQGLRYPVCRLQILWLKICDLTAAACEDLMSILSVNCSLRELDLSLNDLGDPGVLLLCEGLRHPQCRLQTLR